jgi:hypothetical protein
MNINRYSASLEKNISLFDFTILDPSLKRNSFLETVIV